MSTFELVYVAAFLLGAGFAMVTVFAERRLPFALTRSKWLHPMKISLFLTAWGSMGVIFLKWVESSALVHLPISLVLGAVLAAGVYIILPKPR